MTRSTSRNGYRCGRYRMISSMSMRPSSAALMAPPSVRPRVVRSRGAAPLQRARRAAAARGSRRSADCTRCHCAVRKREKRRRCRRPARVIERVDAGAAAETSVSSQIVEVAGDHRRAADLAVAARSACCRRCRRSRRSPCARRSRQLWPIWIWLSSLTSSSITVSSIAPRSIVVLAPISHVGADARRGRPAGS